VESVNGLDSTFNPNGDSGPLAAATITSKRLHLDSTMWEDEEYSRHVGHVGVAVRTVGTNHK
jgi:hypothetical protein